MKTAANLPGMGPQVAAMVAEFQTAMEQTPDVALQLSLITEESMEVIEAASDLAQNPTLETAEAFLKETADFFYVTTGLIVAFDTLGRGASDDVLKSEAGMEAFSLMQIAGEFIASASRCFMDEPMVLAAVTEVHRSNMSKLGDDGKPVRADSGKILKGPNYSEADLSNLAGTLLENFHSFMEQSIAA